MLDCGYLKLVEHWGSDESIICAARMSTQKGFEGWGPIFLCSGCGITISDVGSPNGKDCPACGHVIIGKPGDEKLLAYLWKNNHATPFEMAGAIFEIQAPIFVFREWHRHRTQSYNEMSARYAPLPNLNYVPTVERLLLNSKVNRQAGTVVGSDELTEETAAELMNEERAFNEAAERFYQKKLKAGVSKELARTHLGVSRISRMRASANLRNWLGFSTLRAAPNAQWEIQEYARAVYYELEHRFPRTMQLFNEVKK